MNINRFKIYKNNNNILKFFFNDNIFKSLNKKTKTIKSLRMTIQQNNTNNNSTNYSIDTSSDSEFMIDKSLNSNNIKQKKRMLLPLFRR